MLSNVRSRILGYLAGTMVLVLAGLVIVAVLDAQANGRRALEELQIAQVQQLARSLDSQVTSVFTSLAGFGGSKPWNLTIGDRADADRLQALQDQNPTLRTGFLLLVSLILSAAIAAAGKFFERFLPAPEPVLHAGSIFPEFPTNAL